MTAVQPETGTGSLLHHSSAWHNEGMFEELLMMLLCWRIEGLNAIQQLPSSLLSLAVFAKRKPLKSCILSKLHDITSVFCDWPLCGRSQFWLQSLLDIGTKLFQTCKSSLFFSNWLINLIDLIISLNSNCSCYIVSYINGSFPSSFCVYLCLKEHLSFRIYVWVCSDTPKKKELAVTKADSCDASRRLCLG